MQDTYSAAETSMCRSRIESLPSEVLYDILVCLDIVALARAALTSRSMRRIALQDALWKPLVQKIILETSPPTLKSYMQFFVPPIPLWRPDYREQVERSYSPLRPALTDFLHDDRAGAQGVKPQASNLLGLHTFPGAQSYYQVYNIFFQRFEPLLGWWASDVPSFGMVIRISLNLSFPDHEPWDSIPAFVCQRIHLTNRLQDIESDTQQWRDATGFPMPTGTSVIGSGTILRRNLTQIRTDLCDPGVVVEDLWKFCWRDALAASTAPTRTDRGDVHAEATISSRSWQHSLASHEAAEPLSEEDVEEVTQVLIEAPQRRALALGLDPDVVVRQRVDDLRTVLVEREQDVTSGEERLVYPLSGMVTTRPKDERIRDTDVVQISLQSWQPYRDVEQRNAPFAEGPMANMPMPPVIFPPPALLPAIRSPPHSKLPRREIGMSGIQEHLSTHSRFLLDGSELFIDSMVMDPAPPFRPWPLRTNESVSGLRFFPIYNPPRHSLVPKHRLQRVQSGLSNSEPDVIEIQHTALPPRMDPGHPDFDWSLVEGLYSMTYGPHGLELLYVRARALTLLDFGTDDSLPNWPAEPDMSSDDMYDHMRIDRRHATRIGARVLEGVKVLGDPNIPRGQISWRAFIDDPDRSAVKWRPPPPGYRAHTPWPLRAPQAISQSDERSPGLVLPAHGRVAGEGFVAPGWAPALACISSIDEIQIWWQPMYKVSVAKKLIGV